MSIALIVALITAYVFWQAWSYTRARDLALRWASDNGYQVLSRRRHWLRTGPFTNFKSSAVIFRLELMAPNGQTSVCWLQLGSDWVGMLSSRLEARSDEGELLTSASSGLREV